MGRGFAGVIVANYGRRGGHRNIFEGAAEQWWSGPEGLPWQKAEETQRWCAVWCRGMVEQSPSSMG